MEHIQIVDNFVLTLIPYSDIRKAHFLAKEAIDMSRASSKRVDLRDAYVIENCLICRVDKGAWDMVIVKNFKQIFSHCMVGYVYSKLQTSQVPIQCPQIGCKHYMSTEECKSFLPDNCFESSLIQKGCIVLFPNFSAIFDKGQDASRRACSSNHIEDTIIICVECTKCHILFHADYCVPWNLLMDCEEY